MLILERFANESARDYALRVIKENMVSLELKPGSTVSDKELASFLSLSRTPVREALLELAKIKAIEIYPQRGSRVALIDYAMVEEARFMRNVLECAVVKLLCEMDQELSFAELEENLALQEFYLKNRSPKRLWELDNAFHRGLFLAAGKAETYRLMDSMMIHFDRVRNLSLLAVRDLKTVEDHKEILKQIQKRDARAAEAAMELHLNRYRVDEAVLKEQYPEYFN